MDEEMQAREDAQKTIDSLKSDRALILDLKESNRRIEDKLARIEVAYIELLAKMGKEMKPK